ncbi:MAG: PEP-CTERM system histidine kinase PrsK [Halioglobus sp.]|nr:PEP-CTERM system histidine kinase PrsK [Halioglobus sp.]
MAFDFLVSKLETQNDIAGNIGLYSYGAAFCAFVILAIFIFTSRRQNPIGNALLAASILTAAWAAAVAISTLLPSPIVMLIQTAEACRNGAWIFVLLKLLSARLKGTDHILATNRWVPWYLLSFTMITALLVGIDPLLGNAASLFSVALYVNAGGWLAMSILSLLLLEQYYRNSNDNELLSTKQLCLGLGILFAFDLFLYGEGLLFLQLNENAWQARGLVSVMAAVLIGISVGRAAGREVMENQQAFRTSRHFAFHALTLMASGLYLIAMAVTGYFIRYLGGSWAGVLQITFLCAAGLILIVLLFSGQIRARFRVWLSKNFFSYKYDYRIEWLEFTAILASGKTDVPENITRAVANLVKSPGGILWSRTDTGRFTIAANWDMPTPASDVSLGELSQWLQTNEWIIDLREWRSDPDVYRNLALPLMVTSIPKAWLIIPLLFGDILQGIVLLRESEVAGDLNWEDRDLLKVAGKQAASHLAQFQADKALVESRQFEAFNRLSAYVIHDLKNILAQLSLIVANAKKHKQNPEFIDDMVDTVSNTVERMSKLMAQLRSETLRTQQQEFNLIELLEHVIDTCKLRTPHPKLTAAPSTLSLTCDSDRLRTVFEHLIQNAQDATSETGQVAIRLFTEPGYIVVEIEDNGTGMDEQFIQHRLFKPFDSTKGLTGMGIGAFESRDFIHGLGGEISVTSLLGQGSLFRVLIPSSDSRGAQHAPPIF